MVKTAVNRLALQYEEKGVALQTELPASLPSIRVDAERMTQVMINLLGNAVKFSPSASTVRITATQAVDHESPVELSIIDSGIGMPPDILEHLFEPGKNTTRPGTDDESGTGFGMPLVRRFVQAYGGSIEVLSRDRDLHPGESGTEVRLQLPAGLS